MHHRFLAPLSLAIIAAILPSFAPRPASAVERPNFIVITVDDLGYADIGPFGSKTNTTPALDRMAKEGRKLTSFYAAPVCSPSRASLMTGCYPKRALAIPHVLFPEYATGLDPNEVTVAEVLKEAGYKTACVGKWHLGDQPPFLPTRQGFDYYYGLPYSNDMGPASDGIKSNLGVPLPKPNPNRKGQPPLPLMRNETVIKRTLPDDQQALVKNYTKEAIAFIEENSDGPFFLYMPHSAVHFPLYPSNEWVGTSKNGLHGDWAQEVDWSVGKVLDKIRELGIADDTMVIFTSDNGGALHHGACNDPLRGGKGSTFEGGMRVPTIAWWPGKIPANTETGAIAGNMDILPTLAALGGGEVPSDRKIDGINIWPVLAGNENAEGHDVFYYHRGFDLQAVRKGPWKLLLPSKELYNLEDDVSESKNVAEQHPEIVASFEPLIEAMDADLGNGKELGPGVRPLGEVENAQPLIGYDGTVRPGFEP